MARSSHILSRSFKNFSLHWINIFLYISILFSETHGDQTVKSILKQFEKCGRSQRDKTRQVMKELERERIAETRMVGYHYELLSDFSHCLISRVDVKKCSLIYRPSSQLATTKMFIKKNTILLEQMKKQFIEKIVKNGVEEYSRKMKDQKIIANQSCQVQKYSEKVTMLNAKNLRLNNSITLMGEKLIEFEFENEKLRTTTLCPTPTVNIQLKNDVQDNRIRNKLLLKTLTEKDNLIKSYQKQLSKLSSLVQSQRVLLRFYSTILNANKKIGDLKRIKDKVEMAKILKTCLPFMLFSNEQEYQSDNENNGLMNDIQAEKELYFLTKPFLNTPIITENPVKTMTDNHFTSVKIPLLLTTRKMYHSQISTSKHRTTIASSQNSKVKPSSKKISTLKHIAIKITSRKPPKSYKQLTQKPFKMNTHPIHSTLGTTANQLVHLSTVNTSSTEEATDSTTDTTTHITDVINSTLPSFITTFSSSTSITTCSSTTTSSIPSTTYSSFSSTSCTSEINSFTTSETTSLTGISSTVVFTTSMDISTTISSTVATPTDYYY